MDTLRIVIAGDLHLGRSSSRVEDGDLDGSARGAWGRLVDAAIRERAALLCLTGDVADELNRFWEALGPLEAGVARLAAAGVRTVAVAGNHDHDVLPRLADRLDPASFRLLGRGGRWERWTFEADGRARLHVEGWSFSGPRARRSPLETWAGSPASEPVLGLVHGDLDVADSAYAPLDRRDLLGRPVAGWMLGHVHAPRIEEAPGRPFLVYPGSPQALDPGETGPHGAVVAELAGGRFEPLRRVPLSTVRYDEPAIDVSAVADEAALADRVTTAVESHAEAAAREGGDALRRLVLRLRLHGATPIAARVAAEAARIADYERTIDGVRVSIDRVRSEVRPAADLPRLAGTPTLPGRLARLVLALDAAERAERTEDGGGADRDSAGADAGGREAASASPDRDAQGQAADGRDAAAALDDPAIAGLLAEARRRVESRRRDATWADVEPEPRPAEAEVRRLVRAQAERLLGRLLAETP